MPMRIAPQVQALISRLIVGAPCLPGNRATIATAVAAAPFSGREQAASSWIASDPTGSLNGLIDQPTPWQPPPGLPQELIEANTVLDSATWHTAKHRFNGDFDPATLVHEYLEDLRLASMRAVLAGRVIVGLDPKSGAERVGLMVRLGNGGAPCRRLIYKPGDSLFIAFDPQHNEVLTGFPVVFRTVQKGYPFWQSRIEVTL